jgi:hypothetical protein
VTAAIRLWLLSLEGVDHRCDPGLSP